MRILQVVPAYYPAVRYGGPIRSVHGLSRALVRRGHEVHVFTTNVDGDADLDVPLGTPVDLDGVAVHYFRVPALRRLCWSPSLGDRLARVVPDFDVVHLHSVFLWPTWAAARAAQRARVPYLLSPRGMLTRELIRRKSRWVKSAWIALVERNSLARAAGVHVTAELEADEIRGLRLPVLEIFCVPNGVNRPERHVPLSAGPYADIARPFALFLSRISWKKGLDRLIAAWSQVPDLQLVIAGNDDENYQPRLEALAQASGVRDRVRFLGAVDDEHKWALYENAELFVLPSYSENFGNVVAEAMAVGCPVIVSADVGIASLVREANAGIVTSIEPHSLAQAILALHANPGLRAEMGDRGLRAVADKLSWDSVATRMEAAYRRLATGELGVAASQA